jgi:hypothetical protein
VSDGMLWAQKVFEHKKARENRRGLYTQAMQGAYFETKEGDLKRSRDAETKSGDLKPKRHDLN